MIDFRLPAIFLALTTVTVLTILWLRRQQKHLEETLPSSIFTEELPRISRIYKPSQTYFLFLKKYDGRRFFTDFLVDNLRKHGLKIIPLIFFIACIIVGILVAFLLVTGMDLFLLIVILSLLVTTRLHELTLLARYQDILDLVSVHALTPEDKRLIRTHHLMLRRMQLRLAPYLLFFVISTFQYATVRELIITIFSGISIMLQGITLSILELSLSFLVPKNILAFMSLAMTILLILSSSIVLMKLWIIFENLLLQRKYTITN